LHEQVFLHSRSTALPILRPKSNNIVFIHEKFSINVRYLHIHIKVYIIKN